VVRFDGRGYWSNQGLKSREDALEYFQRDTNDKVAYVGHASSGGEGVTLTKSPTIVHFSNTFDGKSRQQADERNHRMGMDLNKGTVVYDLINLPIDEFVLDNLLAKRRLQDITMGEIESRMRFTNE
jgi:SNF2 family DNA or RNA helicase